MPRQRNVTRYTIHDTVAAAFASKAAALGVDPSPLLERLLADYCGMEPPPRPKNDPAGTDARLAAASGQPPAERPPIRKAGRLWTAEQVAQALLDAGGSQVTAAEALGVSRARVGQLVAQFSMHHLCR